MLGRRGVRREPSGAGEEGFAVFEEIDVVEFAGRAAEVREQHRRLGAMLGGVQEHVNDSHTHIIHYR